jgi:hypothetical protein
MLEVNVHQKLSEDGKQVTVSKECNITGEEYSVTVPVGNYIAWKEGEFAQNAFPDLTAEEREFLISGTTPDEWEDIFKDMDN